MKTLYLKVNYQDDDRLTEIYKFYVKDEVTTGDLQSYYQTAKDNWWDLYGNTENGYYLDEVLEDMYQNNTDLLVMEHFKRLDEYITAEVEF
jgi:hypothetical protein